MQTKVYCADLIEQQFDSLLERLFWHYKSVSQNEESQNGCCKLLNRNYRSHEYIVQFLSSVFYSGSDNIVACKKDGITTKISPLIFFVAEGCEVQEQTSTSYYNMAEAEEIACKVASLYYESWPEEWGERCEKSIAVVASYTDQVFQFNSKYILLILYCHILLF